MTEPAKRYNVREMALHVLHTTETKMAFSDKLLERVLSKSRLDKRDKDFLTMLVKGTLRRRGSLDWVLNHYVKGGVDSVPSWGRSALRLGAFQILFMDRVPPSAATNESVSLARKYCGAPVAGLTNAVLRRLAAEKDKIQFPDPGEASGTDAIEAIAVRHSHPAWMVARWVSRFGAGEAEKLCEANNDISHVDLRTNSLKTTPGRLASLLERQGLTVERGRYNPQVLRVSGEISVVNMEGFEKGLFTVQDESESLVSALLAPHPGELVLDMCSAPGGKTTHLYELMKGIGVLVASDVSPGRVRSLVASLRRMGCEDVHPVVADGARAPARGGFDKVLVDAPCSGMGVIGKKADARWRKSEGALAKLGALQLNLLRAASDLVAEGGALVYSVCSTEPEETTDVAREFLEEKPYFVVDDAGGFLPREVVGDDGMMRLFPHRHGTDGAFAVRFIRR